MLVKIKRIGLDIGWYPEEYETKSWRIGSIVDLSNPEWQLKNGYVVPVDENGNELTPAVLPLPINSSEGETLSGRRYYDDVLAKHKKDPAKLKEYLDKKKKDLLIQLSRIALLKTARLLPANVRQEFLDTQTEPFLLSAHENVRVALDSFIDEYLFHHYQKERRYE